MYIRIMNQLDLECIEEMLKQSISEEKSRKAVKARLEKIIKTLDEFYFTDRNSFSYGGFVFLITDRMEAELARKKIIQCYQLEDKQEYCECIWNNEDNIWMEELYIRSSEDSIVILYPEKTKKEGV